MPPPRPDNQLLIEASVPPEINFMSIDIDGLHHPESF
jgi:hypothetical protein